MLVSYHELQLVCLSDQLKSKAKEVWIVSLPNILLLK